MNTYYNPQNMGTHLNQHEVAMFTCYFSKHGRGSEKNTSNEQNVSSYLLNHNNKRLFHFFNGLVLVCKIYPTALIVLIAKGLDERWKHNKLNY